ncbi:hypothetical protein ACFXNW_04055 [Nocardia sp. NPDC059180]|uniref:hypothetical protein n=1 Tax=Nocardia sp. NPDC059180 TaxID=3346761 RepID=UPI0036B09986
MADETGRVPPQLVKCRPFFAAHDEERARYPAEVLDLYRNPATGEFGKKKVLSFRADDDLRGTLIPDDPLDLWEKGIDVDRVVTYWAGRPAD